MSNESDPPPLRLKPRLRPDATPAPESRANPPTPAPAASTAPQPVPPPPDATIPPAPTPTPAAESGVEAAPKFRLKPKLVAEPAPAIPVQAAAPAAVSPGLAPAPARPAPVARPPAAPPPGGAAGAEAPPPAFKLKPKVVIDGSTGAPFPQAPPASVAPPPVAPRAAPPPTAAPPPGGGAGTDAPPPAFKLKARVALETPAVSPPPASAPPPPGLKLAMPPAAKPPPSPSTTGKIRLAAVSSQQEELLQPKTPAQIEAAKAKPKRKRIILLAGAAFGAIALAVGGFYAYQTFLAPTPAPLPIKPPAPIAAKPTGPTPATQTVVSPTASTPAMTSGSMIENAQAALAERRGLEQARVDNILAGKDPPDKRAIDTPPPGTFMPKPDQPPATKPAVASATSVPQPDQPAATEAPVASAAFKVWVDSARITVVRWRAGLPPRSTTRWPIPATPSTPCSASC
jgi:hypothetical protein